MIAFKYFIIPASIASTLCFLPPTMAATSEQNQATQQQIIDIERRQNIKVVYDVKDDIWEAGVGRALYFMRGLLASYNSMGIPSEQLHISIIMHGAAAHWLLNEAAYQNHKGDPFDYNPNENIVHVLLEQGVSVEICNSTMKAKGWSEKDLLPGIKIVHDAYTRLIDLQMRNYAYIRF